VFDGEYSLFNAALAIADVIVDGGYCTLEYIKDNLKEFGETVASEMIAQHIDPRSEPINAAVMTFHCWETPLAGRPFFSDKRFYLPNKHVPYVAARTKSGTTPPPRVTVEPASKTWMARSIGAGPSAGDPMGFVSPDYIRVHYRGQDNHIHEIFGKEGGCWNHADLSGPTGAARAAGDPMGFVSPGYVRVHYRGEDNHIHELFLPDGSGWHHADLSGRPTGGALAAGNPRGFVSPGVVRVEYRGQDNDIHELCIDQ